MSTPQIELKREAAKYLKVKEVFPRSKLDLRTKLTKYQEKKIKKAINEVKSALGEYHAQIVPMGRGRKKYMENAGLPSYMQGIHLPGGAKKNSGLEFSHGELKYQRGAHKEHRSIIQIDTDNGEQGVIRSVKKILKQRKGRKVTATANNRAIGAIIPTKNDTLFIKEVLYVFNKYDQASRAEKIGVSEDMENIPYGLMVIDGKVYRDRTRQGKGITRVAHPSEWGMGIMFEGAIKK